MQIVHLYMEHDNGLGASTINSLPNPKKKHDKFRWIESLAKGKIANKK